MRALFALAERVQRLVVVAPADAPFRRALEVAELGRVAELIQEEHAIAGQKSQAFFARYLDSTRPPHVGEAYRAFVKQLLLDAETEGLYAKPKEDAT